MLSNIKNIFSSNKKRNILIFIFFVIILFSVILSYVENNLQNIISNEFSKKSNYKIELEDVDFNFSGNLSFDNIIVFNSSNDTLFYSPKIIVNPKSVQNALVNNNFDFENVSINDGVFFLDNYENIDLLINNSPNNNNIIIRNLAIRDFNFLKNNNENKLDLNIKDLKFIKDSLKFSVFESKLDLFDYKKLEKINLNFTLQNNSIQLEKLNFLVDNSSFNSNIELSKIENIDSLKYEGTILNSNINTVDFISGSKNNEFIINAKFSGGIKKVLFSEFKLSNSKTTLNSTLEFDFPKEGKLSNILLNFKELKSSSYELQDIYPNIFGTILPSSLQSMGEFVLKGDLLYKSERIKSNIYLENKGGKIYSDLDIYDFQNIDNASYVGTFKGDNVELSSFITLPFLGKSTFQFSIDGKGFTPELLNSSLEGNIQDLSINNYNYSDINVLGDVSDKIFNGTLNVVDENLEMDFTGLIDYSDELIDFDFSTNIIKANIGMLGLTSAENNTLSGNITTKLRGSNIKDLIGDVSFSDFIYFSGVNTYNFDELLAQSRINNDKRFYSINSPDALSGIIIGDLNFLQLPDILAKHVLASYKNFDSSSYSYDEVSFNLNLKPKIASVLNSEILIDENTFIRGNFNEDKSYEFILTSPFLKAKEFSLKNINVKINDNTGYFKSSDFQSNFFDGKDLMIITSLKDDNTDFDINFNSKNGANHINFRHTIDKNQRSLFSFSKISFDYNNNKWELDESFSYDKNKFVVSNNYTELKSTKLRSENQVIEFRYLNNKDQFDFESIFENVGFSSLIPKPKNILYEGLINGKIVLNKVGDFYTSQSGIIINDFSANGYLLGDAFVKIDNSVLRDKYDLDIKINKNGSNIFNADGSFRIDSEDYPITLNVSSKNFEIKPFSAIGENVLQNFEGYFNSKFTVTGSFRQPYFDGYIKAMDSSFDVPYLGVRYKFPENPSFKLDKMSIKMENFIIQDVFKNTTGILEGSINHKRLKDWFLDFKIDSENLLAINTTVDDNDIYFGLGMFNGNAVFYGPGKNLDINITGSTNTDTKITIPIKYDDGVGSLSYLKFSSNDNTINISDANQGLEVFINLNVNNNAELDIIFDEDSGSKLSGRGEGDFLFNSDYSGNFNIKGEFTTDFGKYHYKNFGFVERIFEIKKGANIIWDGNPYKGVINAEAVYEVPGGANPAPLIQNASFNRKIPTYVNVLLSGELSNLQTPKFEIIFPNTRGSIKSELDYYLNDYEKKQTQAISLISQGFFTSGGSNSLVSSQTITNNLFQRASGIIDEIFTNPDDKMNIGVNYSQGDRFSSSSLLNRDRIGLSLQSEISDRILINGKIGVPVSGTEENVILGDVQIEFLLNDLGNLKARIFNKENEYQFFGDEIGYTQGIGISYDVEFDSFSELIQKIKKNKKK